MCPFLSQEMWYVESFPQYVLTNYYHIYNQNGARFQRVFYRYGHLVYLDEPKSTTQHPTE